MLKRIVVSTFILLSMAISSADQKENVAGKVYEVSRNFTAYVKIPNSTGIYQRQVIPIRTQIHLLDSVQEKNGRNYQMFEYTDKYGMKREAWTENTQAQLIPAFEPAQQSFDMDTVKIVPGKIWSPRCTSFIDEDGEYGKWGQTVVDLLDPQKYPNFFSSKDVKDVEKICPAFSSFSVDQMKNFWVYTLASVSMAESSCNRASTGDGPNGAVGGLLQLHVGETKLYCGISIETDNANDNLKCGIIMLDRQLEKHEELFVQHGLTYWETLQDGSGGDRVRGLLKSYKPCFVNNSI